jgi:hypothetical protein
MTDEQWIKYAWFDEEGVDDLAAGCVGVALGVNEATVRHELGVDEASRRDATVSEAWRISESEFGNDVIQVASIGAAVITFEPNGWHGIDSQVVIELSRSGRYAAYFWNVNSDMQFVFAEGGVIRRDFDPLLYDSDRSLPEESDLPFPSGAGGSVVPGRASLALIERLTGVEITRAWLLDTRHATYLVDPAPGASAA